MAIAPQLIMDGYLNCSGREKTIVATKESISKKFCRAASMDENAARVDGGVPCCRLPVSWLDAASLLNLFCVEDR